LRGANGKAIAITKGMPSLGAAAVEPEKIQPGAPVPADFEKFWQDGIKMWEKAEVVTTPAPEFDKNAKFKNFKNYRIKVTFPDKSGAIDGFLSIPKNAKLGRFFGKIYENSIFS
jgi:cephalosporin-C deacetylase-like acetyl esterase